MVSLEGLLSGFDARQQLILFNGAYFFVSIDLFESFLQALKFLLQCFSLLGNLEGDVVEIFREIPLVLSVLQSGVLQPFELFFLEGMILSPATGFVLFVFLSLSFAGLGNRPGVQKCYPWRFWSEDQNLLLNRTESNVASEHSVQIGECSCNPRQELFPM